MKFGKDDYRIVDRPSLQITSTGQYKKVGFYTHPDGAVWVQESDKYLHLQMWEAGTVYYRWFDKEPNEHVTDRTIALRCNKFLKWVVNECPPF